VPVPRGSLASDPYVASRRFCSVRACVPTNVTCIRHEALQLHIVVPVDPTCVLGMATLARP
ncbi:MAG TPA: hypothetical protein PLP01_06365, partial [Phycisphaerae bacterium]|nr:hypothetical protein [Phycisphaerae bacterium]